MSHQPLKLAGFVGAATLLAVVMSGCNPMANLQQKAGEKVAEKMIEGATGGQVDVDANGKALKITTKDGTYTAGGQSLDEVKKYIKLPDWIVTSEDSGVAVSESTADKKKTIYGALKSEKSLAETKAFWVEYFASENYQNISKTEVNTTLLISGKKDGEQTTLTVTVSQEENNSPVMVAVMFATQMP